jgi:hypothetical protein
MGDGLVHRQQAGGSVAFSLLRMLAIGYCLWGSESGIGLTELLPILRVSKTELARAIVALWDLDLITLDGFRHSVHLSRHAIQQLMVPPNCIS